MVCRSIGIEVFPAEKRLISRLSVTRLINRYKVFASIKTDSARATQSSFLRFLETIQRRFAINNKDQSFSVRWGIGAVKIKFFIRVKSMCFRNRRVGLKGTSLQTYFAAYV